MSEIVTKPIDQDALDAIAARWRLEPSGAPFATHSSVLMPAMRDGVPVMLKLTPEPDEIRGGGLLAWWQGNGAVRVLERETGALLMERPTGARSLVQMSLDGHDVDAIAILCSVAAKLHAPRSEPLPPLEPIDKLFGPLIGTEWTDELVQAGRGFAIDLLATQRELVQLHGDIQHHNVLHDATNGWLAIDPKGQFGERAFDFVNLFRNPLGPIGNDPSIFSRRMVQIEQCASLDRRRLSRWIVAFCALCLVWNYYPQGTPTFDREIARLALQHVK